MTKGRMEAFSDGVIAIIITIMVLELRPPEEVTFEALRPLVPTLLSYLMSFVFLGIYWANHHHMIQAVTKVTGGALWANLHLLFWLSLVPFGTAWMGESHFARAPVAAYGMILIGSAIAYYVLSRVLVRTEGPDSKLARPRRRSQGQSFARSICRVGRDRVLCADDLVRHLHARRDHLAHPRSTNRARTQRGLKPAPRTRCPGPRSRLRGAGG